MDLPPPRNEKWPKLFERAPVVLVKGQDYDEDSRKFYDKARRAAWRRKANVRVYYSAGHVVIEPK